MRRTLFVTLVFVASLVAPALHAQTAGDVDTASEPILRQLDAFRENDYDHAYSFASTEIHSLFDRRDFERMVKAGYPEIADSMRARIVEQHVAPSGHVFVLLKVRGVNGQQVEALYEMVWESGAWKINSVVARPDPGEEA